MNDGIVLFKRSSFWGWCLFDFSNSIPAVIGGIYFSKWFTHDLGATSVIFNILFFLSAVIIVLCGRRIGKQIDRTGYKFWIILSSVFVFSSIILLFISTRFISHSYLIPLSFLFFLIFLFGYQIGRICHNVYLRRLIPESSQSKLSGFGAAANWAGSIFGIVLTIPIISLYPNELGRELTFLFSAIAFLIFTPISLLLMFQSKESSARPISLIQESSEYKISPKYFISIVPITYFLLFEVMATVQRNLPPFLITVTKMPESVQAWGYLLILVSATIGGLVAAMFVTKNNSKSWLKYCSCILSVSIVLITISNILAIWSAFVLAGLSYGIIESAIRLNFMKKFSSEHAGENFGILSIIERTSGVVGPLFWIIPFFVMFSETCAYLFSMWMMAFLSLIALILLLLQKRK